MAESFIAGFAYGATTVLVGQPLDTVKTLQQTSHHDGNITNSSTNNSSKLNNNEILKSTKNGMKQGKHANVTPTVRSISKHLYAAGGIPAFYRGGLPLLLGGGLMRSAQFGVYKTSLNVLKSWDNPFFNNQPNHRICFGIFDPNVIIAGFLGGIGRGMVEGPFEMIKVRRQVQSNWNTIEIMKGSGTTLIRNAGLFMSFAIYMDLSDQLTNNGLSPFWKGGICANLAWLTIWPLDVVKSRIQSGKFEGKSMTYILRDVFRAGHLFQGILPGLTRSFLANGSSMVVYARVEKELKQRWCRK